MNGTVLTKRKGIWARRGQATVEFAMVAPLYFLLVFGIIEFGRIFYVELTLQNAVRQAGRFAVTGDKTVSGVTTDRVDAIIMVAQQAAVGLANAPGDVQVSAINSSGTLTQDTAGGPGDTVMISITANMGIITHLISRYFPSGTNTFTVSTTFRNEEFPASQTM
jgi:Flp pilus assembly protein TadG